MQSQVIDRKEAMNSLAAKEKACAIRTDIIEMLHEAGSGHQADLFPAPISLQRCILAA